MWSKKPYIKIERVANSTSRVVSSVGLAMLVVMMLFTTADVILRYFFNRPILGGLELTQFMLVVVVFTGLAWVAYKKGHVNVDTVTSKLPPRAQAFIEGVTLLMGVVLFALVAWQSAIQAMYFRSSGWYSATLAVPVYPFAAIVSFGSILLSLVLLANLLGTLTQMAERHRWDIPPCLLLGGLLGTSPLWIHWLPWHVSLTVAGLIGFGFVLIFLFSGMPIAYGMLFLGVIGMAYLNSPEAGLALLRRTPYMQASSYTFAVLPMFALMGSFTFHAGLTKDLFNTVDKWFGHLPGGMGIATIGASAGFAAVCGSSLASCVTMGTVALPEMRRRNYDIPLACGCIVAGGTLAPLIPPSNILIIYGLLCSQPIGPLFIAGILPGLLLTFLYAMSVYARARINIKIAPPGPKTSWVEKIASLKSTGGILCLFALVMGGIYFGIFTPTEAAGIGAFGAFAMMLGMRRLNWRNFKNSLDDSLNLTSMCMLLFIGAVVMGYFLSLTRLPFDLADFVSGLNVNRYIVFAGVVLLYIALGCVMESFSLLVITLPILFPLITSLGFDPVWFGIAVVLLIEQGLITPPVGMNVFVLKTIAQDIPLNVMFRGIWVPFACMMIFIVIITAFPQIALFLPSLMR